MPQEAARGIPATGEADLIGAAAPPPVGDFFAGDVADRGGVRVAVLSKEFGRPADLVAATGAKVTAYHGDELRAGSPPPAAYTLAPFAAFDGGVFVG